MKGKSNAPEGAKKLEKITKSQAATAKLTKGGKKGGASSHSTGKLGRRGG